MQPFALQRGQAANEQTVTDGMDGVEGTAGSSFLERSAQVTILAGVAAIQSRHIHDKVGGIFVLPCALRADHLAVLERIHPLAAVDRMAI